MQIAIILIKCFLLIILTYVVFNSINRIQQTKAIEKSVVKIFSVTETSYKNRKNTEENRRIEDGNQEKRTAIYNLDLMIERSGLRKKMPFLNTEVYIGLTIFTSMLGFLITSSLSGLWILGVLVCMVIQISAYGLIYILSGIAYEKIDSNILSFINILQNYSGTNDDIVSIFGKTFPYIESPLKEHIEDFYNESNSSGDTTRAFRNLEVKIENEQFQDIIRNLDICSRHEANYQEIIKDKRRTLKDYLEEKQKRKSIIASGRMEIIMSLVLCAVMLGLFNGFVPNLFEILINSVIGNGILLYCIIVLGFCLWTMISFDKKG